MSDWEKFADDVAYMRAIVDNTISRLNGSRRKKEEKMGRLIDADVLKRHYSWWNDDNEYKRVFNEIIDAQPSVLTPTVTHCAECKYWTKKYQRCGLFGVDKLPEGFCDEAVRRDDEQA